MTAGYSRDFDRALVFAALVHEGVPRKGTAIPYIIHPVQVATILLRHGYDEALAVAGVLHDVLEDVEYDNGRLQLAIRSAFPAPSLPERIVDGGTFRHAFQAFLEAEFATDVLELVRQVTEPKNDGSPRRSWRERKELTVQHLRAAPDAVVALKAADALHNVRSIVEDIAHHGATVLGRFSASTADTAWYYEQVSSVVNLRLSSAPLAVELREARCGGRWHRSPRTGLGAEFIARSPAGSARPASRAANGKSRTARARTRKQANTKTEP